MPIGHDKTGRTRRGRRSKLFDGEGFMPLPKSLLGSIAWRGLNSPGRRFVDFLMFEHVSHAGTENGFLKAPYTQLEEFGISSRDISGAIDVALTFGIGERTKEGERLAGKRGVALYAFPWLPRADGLPQSYPYRLISAKDVADYYATIKLMRRLRAERRRRGTVEI